MWLESVARIRANKPANLAFNRYKKEVSNACGRVVLVNLASDLAPEQNTLMNLVFAAQQHGAKVDAVSLNGSVPILQQACDIASGSYFEVTDSKQLFPMLMVGNLRQAIFRSEYKYRVRDFRTTAWATSKEWRR